MKAILKIWFLLILVTTASAASETFQIGSFAESGLSGWTVKSFKGETEYLIVEEDGQNILQARSNGTASGLVYQTEYSPQEYPILSWQWKVDNIISQGDSRTKSGDDYAARIYVVFPHWFFPKTKTINYIWANQLAKGSFQPSPYTSNATMVAVESGPARTGQWIHVRRNLFEDYRRAFGEDPPDVGAVAIMTDTDNTGESVVAWYGNILASRE
jgi:hypothetical protein